MGSPSASARPLQPLRPALLLLALGLLLSFRPGSAQEPPPPQPGQEENLRVFLDCQMCDFDYFRREVSFVNYVRDRMDAQLHVLVTAQGTGAGGREYTMDFIGLREFQGREDTLTYVSLPDETSDETRAGLVRTFKLGLVPYVAGTPLGRRLDVLYQGPRGAPTAEEVSDPWDLWVFEARVSAELNGEERISDRSFDGSFSANRTTEQIKVDVNLRASYEEEKYELSEGEELTTRVDHEASGTVVWSLGPHWSWGLDGSASVSTRYNHDLAGRFGPAVEYDIYPYAESDRRQITFLYRLEVAYFDYEERTLFDKLRETRLEQTLSAGAAFEQPWGEVDASLEWTNFMDDFRSHRLDFFSGLEIRLFRGFGLDLRGSVARVKNQIYYPRGGVPDEDILLRRRQLETDFEYSFDIGFSYTFGSVFNNVVNPRMGGAGGGDWYH